MRNATEAELAAQIEGGQADFKYGLYSAKKPYKEITTVVTSATKSNRYNWLAKFPLLRDWVGERTFNGVVNQGYHLTEKPAMICAGGDLSRSQLQKLGKRAGEQPNELVFQALSGGFGQCGYDNCYYFDHTHPIYANSDGTGAITLVSNLYQEPNFSGEPFYLLDCSHTIKPIILHNQTPPHLVALADGAGKASSIAVKSGYQLGYSFWQFTYAVKGHLTMENILAAISAMRAFTRDGMESLVINPTHLVIPKSVADQKVDLFEPLDDPDDRTLITSKGRLKLVIM
ncbi:Mu-like prophage major head subunit gpT family protein [Orbaceae bacterium ESL0721]|nr:Mu-like prophage major head subunit gpT family protein [Orbaceae bacterium ESL0721]